MATLVESPLPAATLRGGALFLTGDAGQKSFTDALESQLAMRGFATRRTFTPADVAQFSAAIFVLSSNQLAGTLQTTREAGLPVLVIARKEIAIPPCLAAFRDIETPAAVAALQTFPWDSVSTVKAVESVPITAGIQAAKVKPAIQWLLQVLDRPQLPFSRGYLAPVADGFWSRRIARSCVDWNKAAKSVLPLTVGGRFFSIAVAVAPSYLMAPMQTLPRGVTLSLPTEDIPVEQTASANGVLILKVPIELPAFLPLASVEVVSPLITALGFDSSQNVVVSPGWMTESPQTSLLKHDAAGSSGGAILSLETGELLGINTSPGNAIPAALIRGMLPKPEVSVVAAGLESVDEDFFEAAKAKPEDYAGRNGYDPNFLGIPVPLPGTKKTIKLLPYANFTVALSSDRHLSLYAVVNINGKRLVDKHRAGDPWQLDPRVPEDIQVGGKYYAGTPLDRGHMVRRVDPVWGDNSDQAERDTFHYPNSCPQHKNLNRKIWNDLEDYIYVNLQRDDMKVTVFTGPVLADDDKPFQGIQLPREFWKVVAIRRDDGQLSATAYLLSQEEMVKGLEFVYGEFRTYQVTVALIEKKTGLDFGVMRQCDPKAKKSMLESVESVAAEVAGPQDLNLDFRSSPAKTVTTPSAAPTDAWQDPSIGEKRLSDALNTFDWSTAEQLSTGLMASVASDPERFDEPFARRVLSRLQRKRCFSTMIRVGDTFLQQGISGPQIRRRYAQALIDQGLFCAAEMILQPLITDMSMSLFEQGEAQGLVGRASKQIYVNAKSPANPRNVARLQSAVNSYWVQYALNPAENYWHGINVVACLRRGEKDGIVLRAPVDPNKIATDILKSLVDREAESTTGELQAFELATFVEAHLALKQYPEALKRAKQYADSRDADAFEIASTLRQLEQVWLLVDTEAPGDAILPVLRAALLSRQGGTLVLSAATVGMNLEKVFGSDKSVSLTWYESGLARAKSIARIETNEKGFGTGWLVNSADFFPGRKGLLLVTNAHVIGPDTTDRFPGSLRPEDAQVHFQIQKCKISSGKVVFHSPVNAHDATFLELPDLPEDAVALPLDPSVLQVAAPPQRLYIIGHPGGRDLEFSLQDNHLLAANEDFVHYRTPSEGGSSGSPVFGPTDWKVVALHHAGRADMPRLDGQPGTYEANEGIALAALRKATASGGTRVVTGQMK